ncbi:MAG: hypothetical protein JWN70_1545 [Planctomycetaceae bacterium]|nr:hypothetical protein [Planctomycetaceae bacterium]
MDTEKVEAIRTHFAPLTGTQIVKYQTAELLLTDGTWSSWPDLPIRIYTNSGSMVSVSWSRFDDPGYRGMNRCPFRWKMTRRAG